MPEPTREIYVISDLHIGGRYPSVGAEPGDRGFRICTRVDALARFVRGLAARRQEGVDVELVVNGDFVDFLAEESLDGGVFLPFIDDPDEAVRRLDHVMARDADLFDALAALVATGARLTLLLGNHDLELSFPRVRDRLLARLGADRPSLVRFLYDNEAYVVGDALIEHGNRYDGFNAVDHDRLRRLRSIQSRREDVYEAAAFTPPPGSRLVAELMNPLKRDYPFVDLLKPEVETVVPILLALEPELRRKAVDVAKLGLLARKHVPEGARPQQDGDIASVGTAPPWYSGDLVSVSPEGDGMADGNPVESDDAALRDMLATALGEDGAARFLDDVAVPAPEPSGDIASHTSQSVFGLIALLRSHRADALEKRLPPLLEALRAVQDDRSFDTSVETNRYYLDAARTLAERGFKWIVFGHSHLARRVDLGGGATYLNSGTWSDLIRFPQRLIDRENPAALDELRAFVEDLAEKRLDRYVLFRPTYVVLELAGDAIVRGELRTFDATTE